MDKKWRRIKIGDLGRVVTGNTPPKKDKSNYGGPYPFIKPTDMTVGHRRCNEWEETYSEKAFQRYHRAYIPPGSTGVVTIGTVGDKLFQSNRWCFTNQSVNVVIPHQGQFDPDFVYYLMKVSLPKVENANPGTASGRHHVSKSNFESIGVDVPSYERQQKIGAVLSAYDELIENNLKRIKLLEEKAQQTYEEWFVRMRFPGHESTSIDPDTDLPEGWVIEKVGSLLSKVKSTRRVKASELLAKGVLPVVDQGEGRIAGYTNDLDSVVQKVDGGVIVFGDHTRRLKLVRFDFARGADGTQIVVSNNSSLCQELFFEHLRAIDLSNYHYARHFKFLKEEGVVIPTPGINSAFQQFTGPIHELIDQLFAQNLVLNQARDILLPRLMTGMIDVEELDVELPMTA